MKTYEETIQKLGRQAFDRYMQGSWDTMPDGVSIVAWVFDKTTSQVERDIETRMNDLIEAQVKRHKECDK